MSSAFTWLDFAESDRQQAMQVIDLFREKSTVDELGFGPIRDAFADHFFPGTSTIQTRARYFLFVPWIARRYERRKLSAQEISQKVRGRETRLIKALLAGDEDQGGIIGREALGKLKRMPRRQSFSRNGFAPPSRCRSSLNLSQGRRGNWTHLTYGMPR
jgi:hypothetical protein